MKRIVDWVKGVVESIGTRKRGASRMDRPKTFIVQASHHGTREQKSMVADPKGNKVTVVSTADGGTRLVASELVKSQPVRDFVDAVKAKRAVAVIP